MSIEIGDLAERYRITRGSIAFTMEEYSALQESIAVFRRRGRVLGEFVAAATELRDYYPERVHRPRYFEEDDDVLDLPIEKFKAMLPSRGVFNPSKAGMGEPQISCTLNYPRLRTAEPIWLHSLSMADEVAVIEGRVESDRTSLFRQFATVIDLSTRTQPVDIYTDDYAEGPKLPAAVQTLIEK